MNLATGVRQSVLMRTVYYPSIKTGGSTVVTTSASFSVGMLILNGVLTDSIMMMMMMIIIIIIIIIICMLKLLHLKVHQTQ